MLTERLAIFLDFNSAAAVKDMEKVGATAERELGKAESRGARFSAQMVSAGTAMIGAGALIEGAMFGTAMAADEAEQSHLKLQNTLHNAPQLANANEQAFLNQASSLQAVTKADDEAVISLQSLLGQFGLTQGQILETTPLVLDLAQKMGVDLDTAAKMVGKSIDGSAGALKKAGIVVDENAFANDHYTATLDALRIKVGGFAEQEGKTFSGQLEIMKNQLHDVEEGVGVGAVSAFRTLLGPVQDASKWFTQLAPETQAAAGSTITYAGAALTAAGGTAFLAGKIKDIKPVAGAAALGIAAVSAEIARLNADSEATQTRLFKGIDFSDLEAANAKLNETGQQINAMGAQWDSYSAIEKIVHREDYKLWNDASAQQEEHRKHVDANTEAVRRLAGDMGITAKQAEDLVAKAHVDPSQVGYDTLVATLTAMRNGTISTSDATKTLGGDLDAVAEDADKVKKGLDDAKKALDDWNKAASGQVDAEREAFQSHADLTEALLKNGVAFDMVSQAGRDNGKVLEEGIDAAMAYGRSMLDNGYSVDEATAATNQHIAELRRQALAAGASKTDVDLLIGTLRGTPADISTAFHTPGLAKAIDDARELNGLLDTLFQKARQGGLGAENQAVANTIPGSIDRVRQVLGLAPGSGISWSQHAMGGPAGPGETIVVGEHGPEVMVMGSMSAAVVPNHELGRGQVAQDRATPIVVHTHVILNDREIALAVSPALYHEEMARV